MSLKHDEAQSGITAAWILHPGTRRLTEPDARRVRPHPRLHHDTPGKTNQASQVPITSFQLAT